ncbi:hypothetical protein Smic_57520 [Streptomyces microflavus]|uniref:Uncharacterized protein n=1 Tax=Streptomyces microflavus TaxID=1919 RepID=A0A7J0CXD1_STRMI|nr:hypothetical protein Smic_57520 [Streptomyces microflavus]
MATVTANAQMSVQVVEETVRILVHSELRTAGTEAIVVRPLVLGAGGAFDGLRRGGARLVPAFAPARPGRPRCRRGFGLARSGVGVVLHGAGRHLHERFLQGGPLRAQFVQHDLVTGGQFAELLGGGPVDLQGPAVRLDGGEALLVEHVPQPLLLR